MLMYSIHLCAKISHGFCEDYVVALKVRGRRSAPERSREEVVGWAGNAGGSTLYIVGLVWVLAHLSLKDMHPVWWEPNNWTNKYRIPCTYYKNYLVEICEEILEISTNSF